MEHGLVGVEHTVGCQAEPLQRRARELHRRLGACGDEVAVDNRPLTDVMRRARVPRGEQVLDGDTGVVARVEEARSCEPRGGAADGCDGDAGVEKAPSRGRERAPLLPVPHVGAREDEKAAGGRVECFKGHVGQDSEPSHGRDRLARLCNGHDIPRRTGEASGAELDEEVPDLPVGEGVVYGEMRGSAHAQHVVSLTSYCQERNLWRATPVHPRPPASTWGDERCDNSTYVRGSPTVWGSSPPP